jgi:hypothetical protein
MNKQKVLKYINVHRDVNKSALQKLDNISLQSKILKDFGIGGIKMYDIEKSLRRMLDGTPMQQNRKPTKDCISRNKTKDVRRENVIQKLHSLGYRNMENDSTESLIKGYNAYMKKDRNVKYDVENPRIQQFLLTKINKKFKNNFYIVEVNETCMSLHCYLGIYFESMDKKLTVIIDNHGNGSLQQKIKGSSSPKFTDFKI